MAIARSLTARLSASLRASLEAASRETRGTPLSRALRQTRAHLDESTAEALRTLDRAWRSHPAQAALLAPLYGQLLLLGSSDAGATLHMLQFAHDTCAHPDVAALIALNLWRSGRSEAACECLEAAFAQHCTRPGGWLAFAAAQITQSGAARAAGWVGRDANLDLIGEVAQRASLRTLQVSCAGHTTVIPLGRQRTFRLAAHLAAAPTVEIRMGDTLLLGGRAARPVSFGVTGEISQHRGRVFGWARLGWSPHDRLDLEVSDERSGCARVAAAIASRMTGRWYYEVDLKKARLSGDRITVAVQLPDGRLEDLPDAPLLLDRAVRRIAPQGTAPRVAGARRALPRPSRADAAPAAAHGRQSPVDVIIPVFRGLAETLACIESAAATVGSDVRVVVVDDASDDLALAAALDELAARRRIELLRNPHNLGFVASVNRALHWSRSRDVVLLNSDTQVFGEWLTRLRAAAYGAANVGTVTPWSNHGSIVSYPDKAGAAIAPAAAAELQTLASATLAAQSVEIPVGIGFCLYIRRDCLREVGEFDAALFGHGYGEETDFCLRAAARGWTHRLALDAFVYHAGGVSFGARRAALLRRSQRLLSLRFPGYDRLIARFVARDPLREHRRRFDERRLASLQGEFVLVLTHALAGGVQRYVNERCRELRSHGRLPLLLRAAAAGDHRQCELRVDGLHFHDLRYRIPQELPRLRGLLQGLRLVGVEFQHFLDLDARLVEMVRALDCAYDVVVHDYAWICPRVTLIDGSGVYCQEPPVAVCEACVKRNGSALGERMSVAALRERSGRWLRGAARVTAPSADAAARLRRYYPEVSIDVRPHAAPLAPLPDRAAPRDRPRPRDRRRPHGKPWRVALLGALGPHKGFRVLLKCAREAAQRKRPLEFVLIGHSPHDAQLAATGKVFITGAYGEAEAPYLLEREAPDLVWLPSVWPETWCYVLDYALAAGTPIVAFDLGAIAERLRAAGLGTLLPLASTPTQINEFLLQPHRRRSVSRHLPAHDRRMLMNRSADDVSIPRTDTDENDMMKASKGRPPERAHEGALSASVQTLPLPPGLYLFAVKAGGAEPAAQPAGAPALPAMHVGLAPGTAAQAVEFLSGPSTHGAWLLSTADAVVAKVVGQGALLMLTSILAPNGAALSIVVERIDKRHALAAPSAANAAAVPVQRVSVDNDADRVVPLHVSAHISTRGDMSFAAVPWAGKLGTGLSIESFAMRPLRHLGAGDIEYKALTGAGFETPWISDEQHCGTRGMATPLVGFAVRLKSSPKAAVYDCEYSGYFKSGATIGPLKNGAPCRSNVANDPLEGIQIRLVKRAAPSAVQPLRAESRGVAKPAASAPPSPARRKRKRRS